jgi:hypothetical protein
MKKLSAVLALISLTILLFSVTRKKKMMFLPLITAAAAV